MTLACRPTHLVKEIFGYEKEAGGELHLVEEGTLFDGDISMRCIGICV